MTISKAHIIKTVEIDNSNHCCSHVGQYHIACSPVWSDSNFNIYTIKVYQEVLCIPKSTSAHYTNISIGTCVECFFFFFDASIENENFFYIFICLSNQRAKDL